MKKRRHYSSEMKKEAVYLVIREGRKTQEVEQSLGITRGVLQKWVRCYKKQGESAFPGAGHIREEDREIRELKRQLRSVVEERDILKKALTIFSKMPK